MSQALEHQRRLLHGQEAKDLKYVPKVILNYCQRSRIKYYLTYYLNIFFCYLTYYQVSTGVLSFALSKIFCNIILCIVKYLL